MTTTLTPFEPWTHRSTTYGGRSLDGTWTYYLTAGRCEVTHVSSGRRFWALGLERARQSTADPEFGTALLADPPAGKLLNPVELDAICG